MGVALRPAIVSINTETILLKSRSDVDAIPEGRPPAQFNQISLSIGQYQFRAVKTDYNWGIQPAAPINEYDSFHIARCRPPPMPIRATTLKGSLLQLMRGSDQAIPLDMELVARFVFKYGPIGEIPNGISRIFN